MTTIAWRSGVLAADGRVTLGTQIRADNYQKITEIVGKEATILGEQVLAYALAGSVAGKVVLEAILEEGLDAYSTLDTEDDFQAICVTGKSAYMVNKDKDKNVFQIFRIPEDMHYSIGSGAAVANYILSKGGDPVDAIVGAISTDMGSGGDVTRWERDKELA
mgnify:CR=1 FL=1